MSLAVDYTSFSAARDNLKKVLDAAGDGKSVTIARGSQVSVVADGERLRQYLSSTIAASAQVWVEPTAVGVALADLPFVAEGASVEDAMTDLVLQLREYTEDWETRLLHAPNHANNWGLVQLVKLSTDTQLLSWLEA
ncbi:MAG: hypothetical protein KGL72_04890 [Actinomycetales bacterium]|nr:hypothetical protein [Actinomycetales bacterium]